MNPPAVSVSTSARFIEIGFCCDDAYLQPLTAAIASVLGTAREPDRLRLWVLSKTLREPAIAPLRQLVERAGACLMLVDISRITGSLNGAPVDSYLSEATYYRFLFPDLLPASTSRLIYLDCDLIVCRPIDDLWIEPMHGLPLGAVKKPRAENFASVGLKREDHYFNAGVLLIDLNAWRDQRIAARAVDYALSHPRLKFHDQDALNHVIAGAWQRLDSRWNQQFRVFKFHSWYLHMMRSEVRLLRRDPFIIHYTTSSKPWHYGNDHPFRDRYFEALDRTHYRGWRPAPRSLLQRLRRSTVRFVPHHLRPAGLRNMYREHFHAIFALLHM